MAMNDLILVTGGAGFIGSNFVLCWTAASEKPVVNLDKLTYAGNLKNLAVLDGTSNHIFVRGDVCDKALVSGVLEEHRPRAVIHFAAESHVDRSIAGPGEFIRTNIEGTFSLLECAREYWGGLPRSDQSDFRFLHVSTDEVYGSLEAGACPFTEESRYAPNSPYAASKAAADHLVRAYHRTYSLPTVITNCSNNYGPYQFPEKLIPLMILNALEGVSLPVYGDGGNIRDWLYVEDHCAAIEQVLDRGRPGETYNIGGGSELTNLEVVTGICDLLDEISPEPGLSSRRSLIKFVTDRPGHDRRYAIDASKVMREVGWAPKETFASGIRRTIHWYLDHEPWVKEVRSGAYQDWIELNYGSRCER